MDLDRCVSEYMQNRNVLATRIAGTFTMLFLNIALFFIFKSVPVLVVLSMLSASLGIVFVNKSQISMDNIPDYMSLRSSREVIEYAHEYARPALIFNMTLAFILLSLGLLISLFTSKAIFFAALSIFSYIFLPSFDRLNCYKQMLANHVSVSDRFDKKYMYIAIVLMHLSVCIYLIWKYTLSYKPEIAWIVFCAAVMIYGALRVLLTSSDN